MLFQCNKSVCMKLKYTYKLRQNTTERKQKHLSIKPRANYIKKNMRIKIITTDFKSSVCVQTFSFMHLCMHSCHINRQSLLVVSIKWIYSDEIPVISYRNIILSHGDHSSHAMATAYWMQVHRDFWLSMRTLFLSCWQVFPPFSTSFPTPYLGKSDQGHLVTWWPSAPLARQWQQWSASFFMFCHFGFCPVCAWYWNLQKAEGAYIQGITILAFSMDTCVNYYVYVYPANVILVAWTTACKSEYWPCQFRNISSVFVVAVSIFTQISALARAAINFGL